ncbi:MAG: hypothetical protein KIS94_12270 [Chitinophagales bacterium]|nr:hypothetical protein [Chitinophagales bacterium]
MAIPNYNPYQTDLLTNGFNYLIANLPGSPTVNDLNTTILAYFTSLPNPVSSEALSIMQNTNIYSINNYINQTIAVNLNYGGAASAFIETVLSGIKENTTDSLTDYLLSAQELLAAADINTASKEALYVALTNAQGSCAYWQTTVATPGSWAAYLHSNEAVNYANIPTWVIAAFTAVLSGYAQVQAVAISEPNVFNTQGRQVSAFMGYGSALAVTAGKVIFKWPQKPVINCGCLQ